MSSRRIIIMAHKGCEPRLNAHARFWARHQAPIWLISPADKPAAIPTGVSTRPVTRKLIGLAGHHGLDSIRRFRDMLLMMAGTPSVKSWIFYEYDALCLTEDGSIPAPELEDGDSAQEAVVIGNTFPNGDPEFPEKEFVHPPVAMNYAAALELAIACDEHGGDLDKGKGFWDRWLGWMTEKAGVKLRSWGDHGFSRNTIEAGDFDLAVAAAKGGACMFHGLKSGAALNAVETGYKEGLRERHAAHNSVQP
jgi:hypothetical protein